MSFKGTSWGRKLMAEEWGKATNRSTHDVMDDWRHDDMMKELRSQRLSSNRYRARRTHRRERESTYRASRSNESYDLRGAVEKFERSTGIKWPFDDFDEPVTLSARAETNRPHPKHPNVVITPDGMWRPAPGYTWANREQARKGSNYKVKTERLAKVIAKLAPASRTKSHQTSKPTSTENRPHPKHANVLIRPSGNLTPAPGYAWVDPKSPGYDVKPIEPIPNVLQTPDGKLTPAPGYAWVEPGRKVKPIEEIPNIRHTSNGTMIPEDGYTWVDSDAPGKGVKPEEESSLSESLGSCFGCLLTTALAIAAGVYFLN